MNELETPAIDDTAQPERPERWDEAVVAGYIFDLLRGPA
jgi:hypothetical protein